MSKRVSLANHYRDIKGYFIEQDGNAVKLVSTKVVKTGKELPINKNGKYRIVDNNGDMFYLTKDAINKIAKSENDRRFDLVDMRKGATLVGVTMADIENHFANSKEHQDTIAENYRIIRHNAARIKLKTTFIATITGVSQ